MRQTVINRLRKWLEPLEQELEICDLPDREYYRTVERPANPQPRISRDEVERLKADVETLLAECDARENDAPFFIALFLYGKMTRREEYEWLRRRVYWAITRNLKRPESKLKPKVLAELAKLNGEVKPHKLTSTITNNLNGDGIECTDRQVRRILRNGPLADRSP